MSSPHPFDLTDRVAIVTGAGKSLGKEMARAFAAAGANVVICARTREEIEASAKEIAAETGRTVVPHVADVVRIDQVQAMIEDTAKRFGRIDILVNNAGAGLRAPILETSDEDWQRIIQLDLTAPFQIAKRVVPHMIKRKHGRVINISSALGKVVFPGRAAYCSAKGGLNQFTKTAAVEWAEHGITVNAICPGFFMTDNNRVLQRDPVAFEHYLSIIPQRRFGDCKEIGPLALYLASDAAAYVTGAEFYIDGGWTTR